MNSLIIYLLQGSIIISLFYLVYYAFLRHLTFFVLNRSYLIFSLLAALLLPLMKFKVAFIANVSDLSTFEMNLPEVEINSMGSQPVYSAIYLFGLVYFVGAANQLVQLLFGIGNILWKIKNSTHYRSGEQVIAENPKFEPASFFHFIMLPYYDPKEEGQQLIIRHEAAHARQLHTLDNILIHVARILFWFHPLIKKTERSLQEIHEYLADQEVTRHYNRKSYAQLLLNYATKQQIMLPAHHFNQFQLKNRILMMHRPHSPLAMKGRFLLAIPLFALSIAVFSCENEINDSVKEVDFKTEEDIPLADTPDANLRMLSGNEVFDVVENAPEFPGGYEAWSEFLGENLKYPAKAKEMGIEGTVFLVFEVDRQGKVSNPEILRGIGGGCDEEALRVIQQSPDWLPGLQNGKKVNVRMRLPVRFKLS
jgi:TonB family protein